MFKLSEIRELIRLLDETTISEFNFKVESTQLLIKKADAEAMAIPQVIQAAPTTAVMQAPAPASAPVQTTQVVADLPQSKEEPSVPTPAPLAPNEVKLHKIISPMVGTFYSSPAPDAEAYVKTGQRVDQKSIVCIVEAMKLMNEIEADVKGEIVEVLVNNGQLVEYGQPLFLVKAG